MDTIFDDFQAAKKLVGNQKPMACISCQRIKALKYHTFGFTNEGLALFAERPFRNCEDKFFYNVYKILYIIL